MSLTAIRWLLAIAALWAQATAAQVAEPDSFRLEEYRAPVPVSLRGAKTLSVAEAEALWRSRKAAFVDVMPRTPRPAGLPEGTLWRDRKRLAIPGSLWLPNTGYGALAQDADDYLRAGLERATGGDRTAPLVIYCLEDCWMSWNAAKRAVALGYEAVHWFPDGTDGWEAAGLPLEELQPFEPGQ